jgi:hypothetical protein
MVITVAIIGVIAVIYQLALSNSLVIRTASSKEVALRIASNKLEEMRNLGYASLPVSGSFSDAQLLTLQNATGTLSISEYASTTKKVQVTVSWSDPGVPTVQSLMLVTLITRTGGL